MRPLPGFRFDEETFESSFDPADGVRPRRFARVTSPAKGGGVCTLTLPDEIFPGILGENKLLPTPTCSDLRASSLEAGVAASFISLCLKRQL